MSSDPSSRRKAFHERMQGGHESEIIQHRRTQFAGELMHDVHRFFHQLLREGDVTRKALGVDPSLLFQGGQADVDARQSLGDDIMQLAAEALSLLFLGLQNLTGQMPQLFLHDTRLVQ